MILTGTAEAPCRGYEVSGDALVVSEAAGELRLVAIDALGHGPEAARAAEAASAAARAVPGESSPRAILEACHAALRHQRGAAVAALAIDAAGRGRFAGVGNIRARLLPERFRGSHLVSTPGIVGQNMRKIVEIPFELPLDGLGVLHSDGVSSRFTLPEPEGSLDATARRVLEASRHESDDSSVLLFAHAGSPWASAR